MAKTGRKKKEILERSDLADFMSFQQTIKKNADKIGEANLTDKEREFINSYLVRDDDSEFTRRKKMYMFKFYILRKPLMQDECTYLVNVDDSGTPASEGKRLSKMRICTLEKSAMRKLRNALKSKYGIKSLGEFTLSGESRRMPAKMIGGEDD